MTPEREMTMDGRARTIRFYFDYISPYAYIAWTQIHALAARHGATVEPVPVLFAAMLNAHGQKGPAEIPAKRTYLYKDTLRIAHTVGIPFAPPPHHPFNPLLALRVSWLPTESAAKSKLIDALYRAVWGGGGGAESPEAVARVAREAGFDGEELVRAAGSPEVKDRLRTQSEEAVAAGVFGVPTMRVGDELFWGYDSFPRLEAYLRGEDPVTPEWIARWASVTPSAVRK